MPLHRGPAARGARSIARRAARCASSSGKVEVAFALVIMFRMNWLNSSSKTGTLGHSGSKSNFKVGHELPVVGAALDSLDVVARPGVADVLDLAAVLVRPEVRDRRVGRRGVAVQQTQRGGPALLGRVGPVLDPHLVTEEWIGPAGQVTGGDDSTAAPDGAAAIVAHDAVVDGEAGSVQPPCVGDDADPDHHDLGRHDGPVGQVDADDPPVLSLES